MNKIIVGQRYMSVAEPEIGLGIISKIEDKTLIVSFPGAQENRRYGLKTAPLKRITFEVGDDLSSNNGIRFLIMEITYSETGLLVYLGPFENDIILECDILDTISFHRPEEKLLSGLADRNSLFQLRFDTFKYKAWLATQKTRGFIGARLSLIEHQFYLAEKVTQRVRPRVLLADEVGLGKTIEAGLILHKLIITGRAERVLIVTPNTLNFQWFIEMLRKYTLSFSVVNEQTELDPGTNPFDENNLVITSMELLCGSETARDFVKASKWDLLIVDEAHKLYWKKEGPSIQYTVIEGLSQKIEGLLLLTATPEIYGREGHFSHLRLIDPDRFYDFNEYSKEERSFKEIAKKGRELVNNQNKTVEDEEVAKLIDCHGPGRVYFRNTRDAINADHRFFPKRILKVYPLGNEEILNYAEEKPKDEFYKLKILWLIEFLNQHSGEKILLICHSKIKVMQIEKDLLELSVGNKIGLFHEDLSLMARDRQAAYFCDPEGANLLLCSEIGSEGRNFQFCQNLVLMDLPRGPDLLEQRIGRLDRIGQKDEIYIHTPYVKNSWEEILFKWYDQVFEAFTHSIKAASSITEVYEDRLKGALAQVDSYLNEGKLKELIALGRKSFLELCKEQQEGRDVLIELNSFNKQIARKLVSEIVKIDESSDLRNFLESVYAHFGVDVDDLDEKSQFIRPSDNMFVPYFPFLTEEGFSYTFDRQVALEREDLMFMSWDHPMVIGVMDLISGEEYGNVTVTMRKKGKPRHFLETFHLLDSIAPKDLEVGRFFPPVIIRVLLDMEGQDYSEKWSKDLLDEKLVDATPEIMHKVSKLPKKKVKELVKISKQIVLEKKRGIVNESIEIANLFYDREISRLKSLQKVNTSVTKHEINHLSEKKERVIQHINDSSLRIDSIRFIF